jgi:hypothetical protein
LPEMIPPLYLPPAVYPELRWVQGLPWTVLVQGHAPYVVHGCHKGGVTLSLLCLLFTVYWLLLFPAAPAFSKTKGWAATYGGVKYEGVYSVQQTSDGGYVVSGCTDSFGAGRTDGWVLKLRPDGSIDPSCDFIRDTSILGEEANITILDASASVSDNSASPLDSSATIWATEVSAHFLCHSGRTGGPP